MAAPHDRLLDQAEVLRRVGNPNEITLWRWEKAGLFPRRVKLSAAGGRFGRVGWLESEVNAWLEQRAAAADPEALLREFAATAGLPVDQYLERERLRAEAKRKKAAESAAKRRAARDLQGAANAAATT
jgi:predicted DNA-binding transcriptional regulator AlpA